MHLLGQMHTASVKDLFNLSLPVTSLGSVGCFSVIYNVEYINFANSKSLEDDRN